MKNYSAKDVDAYIISAGREARLHLKELRKIIKSTIPRAEEKISWGIPFYKHQGLLAGFASFKNHISFGLVSVLESKERRTLEEKGYLTGKKTVQIRFDQKIPAAAIKRILKTQAKTNSNRKAKK